MRFSQQKSIQLAKQDKSDKGNADEKIIPLIKKINSQKDYYTTSSCSGRIVLIKGKEKKGGGLFLCRTHKKISFSELKKQLNNAMRRYKGLIYFKMEGGIMHIACSYLQKAQQILDKAKLAGWKKSGIISSESKRTRVMCELRSTENIALPILNKGKILLDSNYLRLLVTESNKKLARTWEKIKKLERLI